MEEKLERPFPRSHLGLSCAAVDLRKLSGVEGALEKKQMSGKRIE